MNIYDRPPKRKFEIPRSVGSTALCTILASTALGPAISPALSQQTMNSQPFPGSPADFCATSNDNAKRIAEFTTADGRTRVFPIKISDAFRRVSNYRVNTPKIRQLKPFDATRINIETGPTLYRGPGVRHVTALADIWCIGIYQPQQDPIFDEPAAIIATDSDPIFSYSRNSQPKPKLKIRKVTDITRTGRVFKTPGMFITKRTNSNFFCMNRQRTHVRVGHFPLIWVNHGEQSKMVVASAVYSAYTTINCRPQTLDFDDPLNSDLQSIFN